MALAMGANSVCSRFPINYYGVLCGAVGFGSVRLCFVVFSIVKSLLF